MIRLVLSSNMAMASLLATHLPLEGLKYRRILIARLRSIGIVVGIVCTYAIKVQP